MNANRLAEDLNRRGLAGVSFIPRSFTPISSKFQGEICYGIEVIVTDRERCEPVGVGLAIAAGLQHLHSKEWDTRSLHRLLGNRSVVEGIRDGTLVGAEDARVREGLSDFLVRKSQYQLYP